MERRWRDDFETAGVAFDLSVAVWLKVNATGTARHYAPPRHNPNLRRRVLMRAFDPLTRVHGGGRLRWGIIGYAPNSRLTARGESEWD